MHELSLANRIVAVAEETARNAGARRVLSVKLKVGDLSGVSIDALRFAYDVAAADTLLARSRLETESVPVTVYCPQCECEGELENIQRFHCPKCQTPTGDVRSGRELEIESIEVDEA